MSEGYPNQRGGKRKGAGRKRGNGMAITLWLDKDRIAQIDRLREHTDLSRSQFVNVVLKSLDKGNK